MPAGPDSLAVTDAYRRRLLVRAERAAGDVARRWDEITAEGDLDQAVLRWLEESTVALVAAERTATADTNAYLGDYVTAESGERSSDAPTDTRDSIDPQATRLALVTGVAAAALLLARLRGRQDAITAGRLRAARAARSHITDTVRATLARAMTAHERVVGWRRVTSSRPCGACLAAATGAVRATSDVPARHPSCSCTAEPVVAGVPERVHRPTGQERFDALSSRAQDRLFDGRGGAAKAGLLRTRAAALDDLSSTSTDRAGRISITEAPLAKLRLAAARKPAPGYRGLPAMQPGELRLDTPPALIPLFERMRHVAHERFPRQMFAYKAMAIDDVGGRLAAIAEADATAAAWLDEQARRRLGGTEALAERYRAATGQAPPPFARTARDHAAAAIAQDLNDAWAESSSKGAALLLQTRAAQLLGLPPRAGGLPAARTLSPGESATLAAYLRAQRQATSRWLDELDDDTLILHRGISWTHDDAPQWARDAPSPRRAGTLGRPTSAVVPGRPLESWSSSPQTAIEFAADRVGSLVRVILSAQLSRDRVAGMAGAGLGCNVEMELVVFGGVDRVTVTRLVDEPR